MVIQGGHTLKGSMNSIVYLIHFDRKHYKAQHYLGWTVDLAKRTEQHRNGTGAKLLKFITAQGIGWTVVRTWRGNYILERKLKSRKKARELCPTCKANFTT